MLLDHCLRKREPRLLKIFDSKSTRACDQLSRWLWKCHRLACSDILRIGSYTRKKRTDHSVHSSMHDFRLRRDIPSIFVIGLSLHDTYRTVTKIMIVRTFLAAGVRSLTTAANQPPISRSDFELQRELKRLNDRQQYDKTLALFDTYERNNPVRLSDAIVTQALKACTQMGAFQRGSSLYHSVASRIKGDSYTLSSLIHLFSESA